ncbi:hypothetical protein MKW94_017781 [Papaver nudicaule]|uniref:Methyltransferase-like protein 1 n=1 Tax=Papaver nudicaule TaxID=74823 RepID=A0AA42B413_PAPNU|nr:hypothetical protein [Papaver nudicaule]
MDGLESIRSYVKRDTDESPDRKGVRAGDEEDWESSEKRKHRSSKSRKHFNEEYAEEWDSGGKRKSTGERVESRKRSGGSSRAGSVDEDDYDARKDARSKQPKKYLEERSDKKSSSGFQDKESESSRKGRDGSGNKGIVAADENEKNSSRKTSSKPSSHEGSQSMSRSKVETSHDGELDKNPDRDSRYSERKESSRDKVYGSREQERNPRRRWDESDSVRSKEESKIVEKSDLRSGKTPDVKHGSSRERTADSRSEHSDSKNRAVDSASDRGTKTNNREEKRVEGERSRSRGRSEAQEEETRRVSVSREERSSSDNAKRFAEKSHGLTEDVESIATRPSNIPHGEKTDEHKQQSDPAYGGHVALENLERSVNAEEDGHPSSRDRVGREVRYSRRSQSPERGGRRRLESNDSGSDNDKIIGHKNMDREKESYRDDRSKGRDTSSWSDRNRDWEGPKAGWKKKNDSVNNKELTDGNFDREREWESQRRECEMIDSEMLLHRPVYRKGRGRLDGGNGTSDSIEIRPKPSHDYVREDSASAFSGRKTETGPQSEFTSATNDERMANVYGPADGQERYPDDSSSMLDKNLGRNNIDVQNGKGRGQQPVMSSNWSSGGQSSSVGPPPAQFIGNNQGSVPFNRTPIQGPKGNNRPGRGGRGRAQGRDVQRVGLQLPIIGPPFVPLGVPPGPMQALGSMSPAPGPPMGHGVMMSPFGGPNVWPGARGVDMNMFVVPPGLSPIPPGPRFPPNMGTGPNPIFYNQPGPMRGVNPGISGPGYNAMGMMGRGMPQENVPANWGPPRIGGPLGKAPSRGEQNDYSQNFVDTGKRPQNYIRELELTNVVEDYPKLRELIQKKDEIVANAASPPMYYKCDLREFVLSSEFFGTKFDVILVDPPWEEYVHRAPGVADHMDYWTFEEILNLKIEAIADTPSFIFLWVGDGVGLEQGRQCLKKWGFRRCEDICWVKTNKTHATGGGLRHDSRTLFQHSKEHCLMGIKGTVRRSTDGHIIHANIDTDIIIAEEPAYGSTKKPEDIYRIIEHFSLGRRRLELFGEDHNIRSGWCTVGNGLSSSNFNAEAYLRNFADKDGKVWVGGGGRNPPPEAPHLVLTTPEIESLRPKSPPQKNQQQSSSMSLTSMNTTNRRPSVNSPQNPNALSLNQEASSATPPTPVPWVSSPMPVGLKGAGPDAISVVVSNDNFFGNYGFNNNLQSPQVGVDHVDAGSSHPGAANMLL